MYLTPTSRVYGYHGCDRKLADQILAGETPFQPSRNDYDWLGHGVYFWENDPDRALRFAQELAHRPVPGRAPIEEPAVLGTIIDLGHCLDFLKVEYLAMLKEGYDAYEKLRLISGCPAPRNRFSQEKEEYLIRKLDCAVIQTLHGLMKIRNEQAFDTVRGVFWEGKELYPTAGFREKNHLQICVRSADAIKGCFRPARRAAG
ncbi:MAG: hypothetical protein HQL51_13700 [Magnetococcales bacterium]|nr:hypothetical protein [Magnetococcales bacterium]